MRKLNAVSMHVSTGFVTIFPACYRKKVSLLPVENLRSFCTWPLWQRSGEGALPLPLTLPCLSTTEKMPRHCPTPRERHAEHPGHKPASQTQNVPTQKMPATQHDRKTDLLFGSPRFSLCWAGCEPRKISGPGCSASLQSTSLSTYLIHTWVLLFYKNVMTDSVKSLAISPDTPS